MGLAVVGLSWSAIILLGLLATSSLPFGAIRNYLNGGLHRYPGPLLANFTNLWHLLGMQSDQHHRYLIHAHRQHGSVVRIGPNKLSISDPDFVPPIYGVSTGFLKSEMYDAFARRVNGNFSHSSLPIQDPRLHTKFGTNCFDVFVNRCNCVRASDAHDVILYLTFSDTLGFMDAAGNIGHVISLDISLNRSALLSAMPWTSYWLKLNPVVGYLSKDSHMFVRWTVKRIKARIDHKMYSGTGRSKDGPIDFLDIFLDAARSDGKTSPHKEPTKQLKQSPISPPLRRRHLPRPPLNKEDLMVTLICVIAQASIAPSETKLTNWVPQWLEGLTMFTTTGVPRPSALIYYWLLEALAATADYLIDRDRYSDIRVVTSVDRVQVEQGFYRHM
ncbi:MAG: hypothetical protein Q9221_008698 [Calogaya cf. arnoldii]